MPIAIAPGALRRSAACALPSSLLAAKTISAATDDAARTQLPSDGAAPTLPTLPSLPHASPGAEHTAPPGRATPPPLLAVDRSLVHTAVRALGVILLLALLCLVAVLALRCRLLRREQRRGGGGGGRAQQSRTARTPYVARDSRFAAERDADSKANEVEGQPLMQGERGGI